jgi:addiction module RelE/StbE family toxin
MRIVWSPQARDDLLEIYRYIAADNSPAARLLHDKIVSRIRMLAESPQIGRPGRVPGTRELVIAGTSYLVPYRVSGEVLQILRIYHAARFWPESFE